MAGALWIVLVRATDPAPATAPAALIIGGVEAGLLPAGVTPVVSLKDAEAALSALMSKAGGGGVRGPVMAATLTGFLITRRI